MFGFLFHPDSIVPWCLASPANEVMKHYSVSSCGNPRLSVEVCVWLLESWRTFQSETGQHDSGNRSSKFDFLEKTSIEVSIIFSFWGGFEFPSLLHSWGDIIKSAYPHIHIYILMSLMSLMSFLHFIHPCLSEGTLKSDSRELVGRPSEGLYIDRYIYIYDIIFCFDDDFDIGRWQWLWR